MCLHGDAHDRTPGSDRRGMTTALMLPEYAAEDTSSFITWIRLSKAGGLNDDSVKQAVAGKGGRKCITNKNVKMAVMCSL